MLTLEHAYVFAGLVFAAYAVLGARDGDNARRYWNALFWALVAAMFLLGSHVSELTNGAMALALLLVGGLGFLGQGHRESTNRPARAASAAHRGNMLFVPALIVPATAVIGTLLAKHVSFVDPKQATIISLAIGVVFAWIAAAVWLRPPLFAPLQEGRRLMNTISGAAILPQMLAALG